MTSVVVLDHYRLQCNGCGAIEVRHTVHPAQYPPDPTGHCEPWPSEAWTIQRAGCDRCTGRTAAMDELD